MFLQANGSAAPGVYALSNAREWILLRTADDVQAALRVRLIEPGAIPERRSDQLHFGVVRLSPLKTSKLQPLTEMMQRTAAKPSWVGSAE
jgi:hypothetical protein